MASVTGAAAGAAAKKFTLGLNDDETGTNIWPYLPYFSVALAPLVGTAVADLGSKGTALKLSGLCNTLTGGDGNFTLTGGDGLTSLYLGNGSNRVQLGGALNTVVLGDGNNTVIAGDACATVCLTGCSVSLTYGTKLSAVLALSVPIWSATATATATGLCNGNFGWFESGNDNIGLFSGWDNANASDGAGNIGAFNGNGNGGTGNGRSNIGAFNGNANGLCNAYASSGNNNGAWNVGVLNGNLNGNFNAGPNSGNHNGYDNLGTLNGNLDGNLNKGANSGNGNGQNNLGALNGNNNGNLSGAGGSLPMDTSGSGWTNATLSGMLSTVVVGNGNNSIVALGGLNTVCAGNGCNTITIGGSYNVVVAGNGNDVVRGSNVDHAAIRLGNGNDTVSLQGAGQNIVETGGGDDVICLSGWGNWVDAGGAKTMDIIYGGVGGDTFVVNRAGQGFDQIYNFTLNNGDQLDLHDALASAGWDGQMGTLWHYLHVSIIGANTWLAIGTGSGTNVAELMGVQAGLGNLLLHNSLIT